MSTYDITDTGVEVGLRELDRRRNDGVEVTLYWEPRTDRVFVAVEDERRGGSFRFEAAAARALEAFHHPYAFAPREATFYTEQAGFEADHDHQVTDELRFVQLTPLGSACSIAIGTGMPQAAPGSVQGLQLVVEDVEAARAELVERGVEVGDVQHFPWARSSSSATRKATAGRCSIPATS